MKVDINVCKQTSRESENSPRTSPTTREVV